MKWYVKGNNYNTWGFYITGLYTEDKQRVSDHYPISS
jgi:hypothetical protein